ncbi:response regulator [Litorilinea aerophila]|nr:response regulator [Litorilinea aerophila]MCC9077591.1 response regulator [Litorilinea aerophila]
MVDQEVFYEEVREALHHLYDYDRLRSLHLRAWLQAEPGFTGPRSLKQILIDAVEALRPEAETPMDAPDWRIYQILLYRFVQGMSTQEVAGQLGLGERHYRRLQARAIERFARLLWVRHLEITEAGEEEAGLPDSSWPEPKVGSDLDWLQREGTLQQTQLYEIFIQVEQLLAPLARNRGVHIEFHLVPDLPLLRIHPQAIRQAMVSTLAFMLDRTLAHRVRVEARTQGEVIQITIQPCSDSSAPAPPQSAALFTKPSALEALAIPRQLLDMYNGNLQVGRIESGAPMLTLQVPVVRRLPVLLVEDNEDTTELFSRYLEGSPYRPVIASSSQEAIFLAQRVKPRAMILDVMMPEQDGWETLILFKAHPLTATIPVIVATILTDRELALSLGADDFLHKPVSQEQLLAALDQVIQP